MIKSIKLTNFFSFRDEEISLRPDVNLLIGVNGSGKSNVFKAIKALKIGVEGNKDDTALRELIVDKWGTFDEIFFKGKIASSHQNSIGLEFRFDGSRLNEYGGFNFREDVLYKIVIIKKPNADNYYISEKIKLESGFTYLDFINGAGHVYERINNEKAKPVKYDDYTPHELALSKISEFDKDRYYPLVTIKRAIRDIVVYDYFDTTPDSKLRRAMPATTSDKKLASDGSNLPQIINFIKNQHRNSYRQLIAKLKEVNSMYTGFGFNFYGSGAFELLLEEDYLDRSVHINHVSDGTLRYLCLLAILNNPERGRFICIDEPEVGLHPDMIHNITTAISEAGVESTFLIATHNENVLNGFKIENLKIFEKDKFNSTTVQSYTEPQFEAWYDSFNVGKMWRQNDFGGNRY